MGLYTKRETWSWSERSRLTIRPELATDTEILQRFKQELILARLVSDRNVIRTPDLGEAEKSSSSRWNTLRARPSTTLFGNEALRHCRDNPLETHRGRFWTIQPGPHCSSCQAGKSSIFRQKQICRVDREPSLKTCATELIGQERTLGLNYQRSIGDLRNVPQTCLIEGQSGVWSSQWRSSRC